MSNKGRGKLLILTWDYKSQNKDENPFDQTLPDQKLSAELRRHLEESTEVEEIYEIKNNVAATDKGYYAAYWKDTMPAQFLKPPQP